MLKLHPTPVLIDSRAKAFGFERLEVKDESQQPTGTWKDRRSVHIVREALRNNVHKLVLISAGNAAYSLGKAAQDTGIEVVTVLDEHAPPVIKDVLRSICFRVIEADLEHAILTPDQLVAMVRESESETIRDVSNGFHSAYASIVEELTEEPDVIIAPVGSGEGIIGIAEGVQDRGWKTKVRGVSSMRIDKLRTIFTPYENEFRRLGITRHSFATTDQEQQAMQLKPQWLEAEPAGALPYALIESLHAEQKWNGTYEEAYGDWKYILMINSGKGQAMTRL